jgi:hypothetical protein
VIFVARERTSGGSAQEKEPGTQESKLSEPACRHASGGTMHCVVSYSGWQKLRFSLNQHTLIWPMPRS